MSKAEKFIEEHTRRCSNQSEWSVNTTNKTIDFYVPWLTTDQARRAVEIAREEMIDKVIEWIEENISEYCDGENIMFSTKHIENIDIFGQERFINNLKKAMKDE